MMTTAVPRPVVESCPAYNTSVSTISVMVCDRAGVILQTSFCVCLSVCLSVDSVDEVMTAYKQLHLT